MLQNKKQAQIKGALMLFLRPKMAADAKLDLDPLLANIDNENFGEEIHTLLRRIVNALGGKVRAGASVDDLHALLNALVEVPEPEDNAIDEGNTIKGRPGRAMQQLTAEDTSRRAMDAHDTSGVFSRIPGMARIGIV